MENTEQKLPENPIEVLLTCLSDYGHILEDNAKETPDDAVLKEIVSQYTKAYEEFQNTVTSNKWTPCRNDYTQNIICIFEAISEKNRNILLSSIGMYGDLISTGLQEEGEAVGQDIYTFYNDVVTLFNDVSAIFSEVPGIDYRKSLQDMISDGVARYPDYKVIMDSFGEQLEALKNKDSENLKFVEEYYKNLNPVEKKYFEGEFVQMYILNTEAFLEQMEIEGNPANMEDKIRCVVGAKRILHRVLQMEVKN